MDDNSNVISNSREAESDSLKLEEGSLGRCVLLIHNMRSVTSMEGEYKLVGSFTSKRRGNKVPSIILFFRPFLGALIVQKTK